MTGAVLPNKDLTVRTSSETASPLRTVGGAEAVRMAVVVGALGVVFGDIGTSPIYTVQTVFSPERSRTPCRSTPTTSTASCP